MTLGAMSRPDGRTNVAAISAVKLARHKDDAHLVRSSPSKESPKQPESPKNLNHKAHLPMTIQPNTAAALGPTTSTSADSGILDNTDTDTFLRLLVTQIQNQDPLNPQDPTEFISQLAEFSSLENLIEMRRSLEAIEELAAAPVPAADQA